MKTAKMILIVAAFAAPVLLHAQEQSIAPAQAKAKKDVSAMTPLEKARFISSVKGSRKIIIAPHISKEGIANGCVIAYGHYLKAPYQVKNVGNKVLINGVQVTPSLVREREQVAEPQKNLTPTMKERFKRKEKLEIDAYQLYHAGKGKKNDKDLKQEILDFVKKSPEVIDAHWDQVPKSETLFVRYVESSSLTGIGFYQKPAGLAKPDPNAKEIASRRNVKIAEDVKKRIIEELGNGACFIFHSDGGRSVFPHADVYGKCVRGVMNESELTTDMRIEKIAKCFADDYRIGLDIVENYNPEEWDLR